jgi:8-oxo-dGTP diphosphatase
MAKIQWSPRGPNAPFLTARGMKISFVEMQALPILCLRGGVMQKFLAETVSKKRSGAVLNVYLFLRQDAAVLLSLRNNTGYCDGLYGLISGHVEDGESATAAMIREAYEETGIQILSSLIKPVHIMHRKTDRINLDIFYECRSWTGTLSNRESQKCSSLDFFPIDLLPSNTIPYIKAALEASSQGTIYSEEGWT